MLNDTQNPKDSKKDTSSTSANTQKERLYGYILILIVFFVISVAGVPLIVNYLLHDIPLADDLEPANWLGFWGSYLGGLLGSIAALLAINESRKQAKQQHEENREDRRLAVVPAINVSYESIEPASPKPRVEDYCILEPEKEAGHCFKNVTKVDYDSFNDDYGGVKKATGILNFTNTGMGPAFQIKILYGTEDTDGIPVVGLKVGQTSKYAFKYVPPKGKAADSYDFRIRFSDLLGNAYEQKQTLNYSCDQVSFDSANHPTLLSRFD